MKEALNAQDCGTHELKVTVGLMHVEILRGAHVGDKDAGEPIWYRTFKVNGLKVIEGVLERGGEPNHILESRLALYTNQCGQYAGRDIVCQP